MICSVCMCAHSKLPKPLYECTHRFCRDCLLQMVRRNHNTCPLCRSHFNAIIFYVEHGEKKYLYRLKIPKFILRRITHK